jgi:curli biogenesis system outer membrane secretion channel CsgG
METQHKSIGSMRAYLLGVLPDDEATALEEDYFVDRKSLHRLQTEEAALIIDYLDGRLGKKESQLFEGRYLRVPELHRKVEAVRHARRALPMQSKRALWMRWSIAAAAALALVLGLGVWNRQHLTKRPESATQAQPVKQESPVPSQPLQDRSATHKAELERPLVPQVASSKKKSIAGIRQHKNDAIPAARSLEDYLFADSPAPRDVAATVASTSPDDRASAEPPTGVQRKKRIAVLDFDYGTVQSYVSSIYGSNQDVGKGITDMLVEKLVKDGKYSVIDRNALDKVLAEHDFSNSDRANPAMAAKIGQLLGVDSVIMGSVTKFGRDDKSKAIGGAGLSAHGFGIGGIKRNEAKAVCAISARLVDTRTGEILVAVTGEGESKRSGTSLLSAGGGGTGSGVFDTHASNFGQTLLGEAVTQAILEVGSQLNAGAIVPASRKVEASGFVTGVDGITLVVNIGSKAGLRVGDQLDILRLTRTVQDPASGKVFRTPTLRLGIATVTEVDIESATATFKGTLPAKVGDVAKIPN